MEEKQLKTLVIPAEGREDVRALVQLSADQLIALGRALADKNSLRDGKRTYRRVAEEVGVPPDTALGLLGAVANLRAQREQFNISEEALFEDLGSLALVDPATRDHLSKLLHRSEDDDFVEKVGRLRHGIVAHMTKARSIVEARPVFSKDRSTIEGMVLGTYLEIQFHDPRSDEHNSHVLQLTRKQLKQLRETIDDAERKLDKMTETLGAHDVYE